MTPPLRLDLLSRNGPCKRYDLGKIKHLRMLKVVGGVMTPPYESIVDSSVLT